jgi:hypothetical protein
LVWYGPVALLLWVYIIGFIHLFTTYRPTFTKSKVQPLDGLDDTIGRVNQDIGGRIADISDGIVRIGKDDDLISLQEEFGFLDVLGVDRNRQKTIANVARAAVILVMFSCYYVAYAVFLYGYRIQV